MTGFEKEPSAGTAALSSQAPGRRNEVRRFVPLQRDRDPYLLGRGGNCGTNRLPQHQRCTLCYRQDGEWHQENCPADRPLSEWIAAEREAVDEARPAAAGTLDHNPGRRPSEKEPSSAPATEGVSEIRTCIKDRDGVWHIVWGKGDADWRPVRCGGGILLPGNSQRRAATCPECIGAVRAARARPAAAAAPEKEDV